MLQFFQVYSWNPSIIPIDYGQLSLSTNIFIIYYQLFKCICISACGCWCFNSMAIYIVTHLTNFIWLVSNLLGCGMMMGKVTVYSLVSLPLLCGSPAYEELLVAYVLTQNQHPCWITYINNVNASKQIFCCSILVEYCSLIIGSIILFSNYR